MKHTFFILAIAGSLLMMNSGCKKMPSACIHADTTSIAPGGSVSFQSCALDAEKVEWEFGDGATATGNTVSHTYNEEGIYLVTQKAYSKKDKKFDKASVVIHVTKENRYLTKVVIRKFPEKKLDNTFWDPDFGFGGTDADVFVRFSVPGSDWQFETAVTSNAKQDTLPLTYHLGPSNIFLSNQTWRIDLRDDDSFGTTFVSELMARWELNPSTTGDNGIIALDSLGVFGVDIYYEVR